MHLLRKRKSVLHRSSEMRPHESIFFRCFSQCSLKNLRNCKFREIHNTRIALLFHIEEQRKIFFSFLRQICAITYFLLLFCFFPIFQRTVKSPACKVQSVNLYVKGYSRVHPKSDKGAKWLAPQKNFCLHMLQESPGFYFKERKPINKSYKSQRLFN